MRIFKKYKYLALLFLIILGVVFYLLWPRTIGMICDKEIYGKNSKLKGGILSQENIPDCMKIAQGSSCYNYQLDQEHTNCLNRYGVSKKKNLEIVPR